MPQLLSFLLFISIRHFSQYLDISFTAIVLNFSISALSLAFPFSVFDSFFEISSFPFYRLIRLSRQKPPFVSHRLSLLSCVSDRKCCISFNPLSAIHFRVPFFSLYFDCGFINVKHLSPSCILCLNLRSWHMRNRKLIRIVNVFVCVIFSCLLSKHLLNVVCIRYRLSSIWNVFYFGFFFIHSPILITCHYLASHQM